MQPPKIPKTNAAAIRTFHRYPRINGWGWALLLVLAVSIQGLFFKPSKKLYSDAAVGCTKTQLHVFQQALTQYIADHHQPPTTEQGLWALVNPPIQKTSFAGERDYLAGSTAIPKDVWGNAYRYLSPGEHGELYVIRSYGADGRPGGTGYDADLVVLPPAN
jgi:general secretion pathway protein G